jgi:hypothetical protein
LQHRRYINKWNKETKQGVTEKIPAVPVIKSQFTQYQLVEQEHNAKAEREFKKIDKYERHDE